MAKFLVKFDMDRCKSCDLCASVCPKKILKINLNRINRKGYHPMDIVDQEICIGCAQCATICPDSVISVYQVESN